MGLITWSYRPQLALFLWKAHVSQNKAAASMAQAKFWWKSSSIKKMRFLKGERERELYKELTYTDLSFATAFQGEKIWRWRPELITCRSSHLQRTLDDLATTCNCTGGVGARHDQILSHGRPSLAESEPTVQCALLFSPLLFHMKCTSHLQLSS